MRSAVDDSPQEWSGRVRRTRPCGGSHSIPALSSPFDSDLTPYTRNLARRLSAGYETASSLPSQATTRSGSTSRRDRMNSASSSVLISVNRSCRCPSYFSQTA